MHYLSVGLLPDGLLRGNCGRLGTSWRRCCSESSWTVSPATEILTMPPNVHVDFIRLSFLACLVRKYRAACFLSRSSLTKIFLRPASLMAVPRLATNNLRQSHWFANSTSTGRADLRFDPSLCTWKLLLIEHFKEAASGITWALMSSSLSSSACSVDSLRPAMTKLFIFAV